MPILRGKRLNLDESNLLNYNKVKLKNPHLVIALVFKGIPSLFGLPGLWVGCTRVSAWTEAMEIKKAVARTHSSLQKLQIIVWIRKSHVPGIVYDVKINIWKITDEIQNVQNRQTCVEVSKQLKFLKNLKVLTAYKHLMSGTKLTMVTKIICYKQHSKYSLKCQAFTELHNLLSLYM